MSANLNTNLLTAREVSAILGIHPNTVRNWADAGILTPYFIRASGFRRYDPAEVMRVRKMGKTRWKRASRFERQQTPLPSPTADAKLT